MSNQYGFMQSGFNGNSDELVLNNYVKDATALLVIFMENAIRNASIYIKHCKRNCITTEDIKRALMLEVFLYKNRNNDKEKINEVKNEIFYSSDDDDLDGDYSNMVLENHDEFGISQCECGMCKCINNIYDRWERFNPNNQLEIIFKKHIDKM
tara:strand:+ start:306 stop:764 length:459 start_codon:yes stop_codon:yes gene_type:complete